MLGTEAKLNGILLEKGSTTRTEKENVLGLKRKRNVLELEREKVEARIKSEGSIQKRIFVAT